MVCILAGCPPREKLFGTSEMMMVGTENRNRRPFGLLVSGEADSLQPALERIVGPSWIRTFQVNGENELLEVVESGLADAAVLDDGADWTVDVLQLLRMIRRLDEMLPVVVLTRRRDRRWLENALRLTAFSVVTKPLQLEDLLRQVRRIMIRIDMTLRIEPDEM